MTWVQPSEVDGVGLVAEIVRGPVSAVIEGLELPILVYFLVVNTSYLLLIVTATLELARHLRRVPFAGYEETQASPLTQPVSVLVPAYNEEAGIVASVRALLGLRYPEHEVVVVDDGSTDATLERLRAAFDLVEVPRVIPADVPVRGAVVAVMVPRSGDSRLVVVTKTNGGKTDSLNLGTNLARFPLLCMVDADSILEPDALVTVTKPFADDPDRVVATGGVIRAANGCRVVGARVTDVRMPTTWLPRIQVVEYLRAFLLGRTGWSRLRALMIISGAFGVFRRDVVVMVGGLDPGCIGEDAELVVRIHHEMRRRRRPYRMVFVAEPVSWTEVPTTRRVLASQRRRWHRGLCEITWKHRGMILNPRYGRIGMLALPYIIAFELLAPVLEIGGFVLLVLGLSLGITDLTYAWLFLLVIYGYGLLVSMAALVVEEFSFHRYGRWRDLGLALLAAVAENLGYRQLTALWRVQGILDALRGSDHVWGEMTRTGFGDEPAPRVPLMVDRP